MHLGVGGAGHPEFFTARLYAGNEGMKPLGVIERKEGEGGAGIDDGGLAGEVGVLPVRTGVIQPDLPHARAVDDGQPGEIALDLGPVDVTKGDDAVVDVVELALQADADRVGSEVGLSLERPPEGPHSDIVGLRPTEAEDAIDRVGQELVRDVGRQAEGEGDVQTGEGEGIVADDSAHLTGSVRDVPGLVRRHQGGRVGLSESVVDAAASGGAVGAHDPGLGRSGIDEHMELLSGRANLDGGEVGEVGAILIDGQTIGLRGPNGGHHVKGIGRSGGPRDEDLRGQLRGLGLDIVC